MTRRSLAPAVGLLLVAGLMLTSTPGASATTRSSITGQALGPWSAQLTWTLPQTAAAVHVLRDGRLLDGFAASAATTYTDHLLWPATSYAYEVKGTDANGQVVADLTTSVTTATQVSAFPRLYAESSFWNARIAPGAPIDPASAAIVAASVSPYAGMTVMNDNDHWGIPIAYADPASELYQVGCTNPGCNPNVFFRVPRYASPNLGSDGKLVIIDATSNQELDMGRAAYDPVADAWTTGNRFITPSDGWGAMCGWGQHCSGVLMSGLAQFGGVVRPEEFAQGHIDHAVALSVPYWSSTRFVCPATKLGGGFADPNAIPLGAHVQLDPAVRVGKKPWPAYEKVVAVALQRYGGYVADGGSGSFEVRAETSLDRGYDAWGKVGIPSSWPGGPTLNDIPWSRLRVLTMTTC